MKLHLNDNIYNIINYQIASNPYGEIYEKNLTCFLDHKANNVNELLPLANNAITKLQIIDNNGDIIYEDDGSVWKIIDSVQQTYNDQENRTYLMIIAR